MMINLPAISPTRIRDYIICPLQYKFKYIEQTISFQPSPQLSYGISMHKVLEMLHDPQSTIDSQEIEIRKFLQSHWDQSGYANQEESETYFQTAAKALEYYLQKYQHPEGLVIGTEVFLSSKIRIPPHQTVRFSCKADRIQINPDDTLEIIDYKTNASGTVPSLDFLKSDLPTFIYYLLARVIYAQYKHVIITYLNLQSLQKVSMDYSVDDLAANKTALINVVNQINSHNFAPKAGPYCSWCPFRKDCPIHTQEIELSSIF